MKWRPVSELPEMKPSDNIADMRVSKDVLVWFHQWERMEIGFCRKFDDGVVQWAGNRGVFIGGAVTHWCEIAPPTTEGPKE